MSKIQLLKFDYDKLQEQIKEQDPKYLIVNKNTFDRLGWTYLTCERLTYSTYRGIPIAICNKLEDGVVDLV